MSRALWNDEHGAIVSIEMVLIITISVLALIVGWSEVAVSVNSELDDIGNSLGRFDQSYYYSGFSSLKINGDIKNRFHGATFTDAPDDCDNGHAIVCAVGSAPTGNG